jgi:hypothetical protein
MKRLLFILTLIVIPLGLSAQTSLDDIYDDYAGKKGYQSVIYGKKMITMMKENASSDVRRLLNGISMIRIISHSGSETALYDDVNDIVRKEYDLISRIDEEGNSSLFYLYEDNDEDMSFVMISSGEESKVVLEIIGQFDVKDISKLSIIGQKK